MKRIQSLSEEKLNEISADEVFINDSLFFLNGRQMIILQYHNPHGMPDK